MAVAVSNTSRELMHPGAVMTIVRRCAAVAAVLVLAAPVGAGAEEAPAPHYSDAVGDATGLWGPYVLGAFGNRGPDTRPASVDSADLLAAWFTTSYRVERDRDEDGRVVRVRHLPDALDLHVRTAAPASPTFGPSVSFNFYGQTGACYVGFAINLRGPASDPGDPPQKARLYRGGRDCPGGFKAVDVSSLRFEGSRMVASFPFRDTVVDGVHLLPPGAVLESDGYEPGAEVMVSRAVPGAGVHGLPPLDTADGPRRYVVGSDVPADVDCASSPAPACG